MATVCRVPFTEIKLIWRPAPHQERLVVGTLRAVGEGYAFRYDGDDLDKARSLGFEEYPGMKLGEEFGSQAIGAFASRLPGRDRPDFGALVGNWDGDPAMDDFALIGLTGARLPTDMFEFIPVIEAEQGVSFLTDLAGHRFYAASDAFRQLARGTELELFRDPENAFDRFAVRVDHRGQPVAFVKKVHSESVVRAMDTYLRVSCALERVRMNGAIKEIVVRISFG